MLVFKTIGLDVGLTHFYTDSYGQTVDNPRHPDALILGDRIPSSLREERSLFYTSNSPVKIEQLQRKCYVVFCQIELEFVRVARADVYCTATNTTANFCGLLEVIA